MTAHSWNYVVNNFGVERNYIENSALGGYLFNSSARRTREYIETASRRRTAYVYSINGRVFVATNGNLHGGVSGDQILGHIIMTKNLAHASFRAELTHMSGNLVPSTTDAQREVSASIEAGLQAVEATLPPLGSSNNDEVDEDDDDIDLDDDDMD